MAKKKSDNRQWMIPCKVIFDGARMLVTASSKDEAVAKARRNEWDDIEYAHTAYMTDWKPNYEDIEEDE